MLNPPLLDPLSTCFKDRRICPNKLAPVRELCRQHIRRLKVR